MQRLTAVFVFVAALLLPFDDARAQMPTGTYPGMLDCAQLPFTKGPQRAAVQFRVERDKVTYSRTVKNENNTAAVGTETGNGTIAADGATSLTGGWRGSRDSYSASYSGRLSAKGGKLGGQQNWTYKRQRYTRDCAITVSGR